MPKVEGARRSTGRDREEWFALLDEWGAVGRPYRQIAAWLTDEHQISKWWAQKLIVEYEQERGVRAPGVRRDGTFEVGTSKTMDAPLERVFEAVVDGRRRRKWLTDGSMTLRTARPGRSARFDWEDGTSRVNVDFAQRGPGRSTVSVTHQRLPDEREAQAAKARWKERLAKLKASAEA